MNKSLLILPTVLVAGLSCGYLTAVTVRHGDNKVRVEEITIHDEKKFHFGRQSLEFTEHIVNHLEDVYSYKEYLRKLTSEELKKEFLDLVAERKTGKNFSRLLLDKQLKIICERWGQVSPIQALQEISRNQGFALGGKIESLFSGWASVNPEKAARFYEENKEHYIATEACTSIAMKWSALDPEGAWKWMDSLDKGEKEKSLPAFFHGLVEGGSNKIPEFIKALPEESRSESGFVGKLITSWYMKDSEKALSWANALSAKETEQYKQSVFKINLAEDKAKAAGLLAGMTPEEQSQALAGMNYELDRHIGEREKIDFIMEHAHPDAIENYLTQRTLFRAQSNETWKEWINTQEPGNIRDKVIDQYVNYGRSESREESLGLIQTISNGQKRRESTENLLVRWSIEDREAALRWIESSDLQPEDRKKVYEKIEFNRKEQD